MVEIAGESDGAAPAARKGRMSTPVFLVALVGCLAGVAILLGLGTWQVERLQWKQDLLATIEARRHSEPVSLGALEGRYSNGEPVDYVPVTASGRFMNGQERYFLSTFEGESGWNVYAPLRTRSGDVVFVNRGFVPYARRDPATRPGSRPDGVVTVTGLARSAPDAKPGYFVPENAPEEDSYYWRDLEAMATGVPVGSGALVPFFVDAGRGQGGDADTLPVGGTTQVSIPNNHLQYAVTWYGLAAVLTVMTGLLVFRHLWPSRTRGTASDA